MPKYDQSALLTSALAVMLERSGGSMTYTQTEFAGVLAKHGGYVVTAEVDRSGPGEPRIHVAIEPSNRKGTMPVA